jgi:hypothetical protein
MQVKEVGSGAVQRAQRQQLINAARRRELDAVPVWRLDRWDRCLVDLVTPLQELTDLNIGFVSLSKALDLPHLPAELWLQCCPCLPPSNTTSFANASGQGCTMPGRTAHASGDPPLRQSKLPKFANCSARESANPSQGGWISAEPPAAGY